MTPGREMVGSDNRHRRLLRADHLCSRAGRRRHAIGEVCRKAGISEPKPYNWRKGYDGLMPSEVKLLRQLLEQNGKLKRLVADLILDKALLQDVLAKEL